MYVVPRERPRERKAQCGVARNDENRPLRKQCTPFHTLSLHVPELAYESNAQLTHPWDCTQHHSRWVLRMSSTRLDGGVPFFRRKSSENVTPAGPRPGSGLRADRAQPDQRTFVGAAEQPHANPYNTVTPGECD